MIDSLGFMQGRLCDCVEGKIQAFPWQNWEKEFAVAKSIDLHLMEWTLDHDNLSKNPLMTAEGRAKIRHLCEQHDFLIPSVTGDCFMQQPFWKVQGKARTKLQSNFLKIVQSCSLMGIKMIVVPLVDNGRVETIEQRSILVDFLLENSAFFAKHNLQIIFESDFKPSELARFIENLPNETFGINYDIGNSAALGFKVEEEFEAYGERVVNVHVKDRSLRGPTVPLNTGNADFSAVFYELSKQDYQGNFILQTARASAGNHSEVLEKYRDFTLQFIRKTRSKTSK